MKSRDLVAKLFNDLAKRPELTERQGGYTRIIKVGNRRGDNAPMSRISWVGATLESTETLRYPEHVLERMEANEFSYSVDAGSEEE